MIPQAKENVFSSTLLPNKVSLITVKSKLLSTVKDPNFKCDQPKRTCKKNLPQRHTITSRDSTSNLHFNLILRKPTSQLTTLLHISNLRTQGASKHPPSPRNPISGGSLSRLPARISRGCCRSSEGGLTTHLMGFCF